VSCPSSSLCLATDNAGNILESAAPTGGAAAWTATSVDANDDLTAFPARPRERASPWTSAAANSSAPLPSS
jgi:hypothetical protein